MFQGCPTLSLRFFCFPISFLYLNTAPEELFFSNYHVVYRDGFFLSIANNLLDEYSIIDFISAGGFSLLGSNSTNREAGGFSIIIVVELVTRNQIFLRKMDFSFGICF